MTTKRILTIIAVLILLATVFLGVAWYANRKTAEKNGTTPLTFRQFLGVGTPNAPGQSGDGELVGEFTGESQKTIKYDENNNGINDWLEDLNNNGLIDGTEDFNNNGIPDGQEDADNDGTRNNQDTYLEPDADDTDITPLPPDSTPDDPGGFTDEVITPEGGNPGGGSNPGGSGNPGGSSGEGNNPGNGGGGFGDEEDIPGNPYDDGDNSFPTPDLSCSAADSNIVFTDAELARLKTLQNRFDAIKATLYDDAASNQQLSLYTSFKFKKDQTVELLNFCKDNVSRISNSKLNRRVPTPFYHDSSQDSNTFTNNPVSTSDANSSSQGFRPIINNPITITTMLERLLRINIW
ncbi:hypothetical protein K2Q02_02575 [Patescibacteria group bacterium]|nr:hypothetical protein [Patescibacteria group bacterium]